MTADKIKIALLGASFDTGNLGVNALSESAIKCLLNRWPDAEFFLIGMDTEPGEHLLQINNKKIIIKKIPVRFSKNIFLPYHFFVLFLYALILRLIPSAKLKTILTERNQYVKDLESTVYAMDITGGDSFSDIYGMRRFTMGFLRKWLLIFYKKPLLLLPQTYGPYKSHLAKLMAGYILKKSKMIYSRDADGVSFINEFLKNKITAEKIKFIPDVAFILDPRRPENPKLEILLKAKKETSFIVGLNVSGLLYMGGYSRDNMFNLSINYQELIYKIIDTLMSIKDLIIILIPHVIPSSDLEIESDPGACKAIYNSVTEKYKERIIYSENKYDQNEIKYIIGLCDMLIGSRMHACIAALSQCIPAAGLAYSKKFIGVFQSAGVEDLVIDLRSNSYSEIINSIRKSIDENDKIRNKLKYKIPLIQAEIYGMCEDI